jgi:hypothetical protein
MFANVSDRATVFRRYGDRLFTGWSPSSASAKEFHLDLDHALSLV